MNFYAPFHVGNSNLPIRVHPLLLSLTETISASETNPDISTISENDERALRSNHYTSPNALPPLEIHFSGQNGRSLFSKQKDCALTSVAGCRECIASALQDSSGRESSPTQGNSAATTHTLEDNFARIGSVSLSPRNKGKKRRRAFSGSAQGNISNTRGPKVAGVIRRTKGNQVQKAGLWGVKPSPPKEKSDKFMQEGGDREAEPCMFNGAPVQNFANDTCCSLMKQMTILH